MRVTAIPVVAKVLRVRNPHGLHERPAVLLAQALSKLACEVTLEYDGERVNGKSALHLLMLGAEQGADVRVEARGKDAAAAIATVETLFHEPCDGT